MTQSIPPVSISINPAVAELEESPKSWWDKVVGFIFAEEEAGQSVESLKEKKIMEIDPDVLRQKRLVEEAVATRRENEKRIAAEKAAAAPNPVEKVAPAPAPQPSIPKAAATPNPVEEVAPAPAPQPGIAVDDKMRQVAQQRLDRLSARLATVAQRLVSLEREHSIHAQQLHGLENENKKAADALAGLRRGTRHVKQRKELNASLANFKEQMAFLSNQMAESTHRQAAAKAERTQMRAAMAAAQKVVNLLEGARVMPQELEALQKAAEAAELSIKA